MDELAKQVILLAPSFIGLLYALIVVQRQNDRLIAALINQCELRANGSQGQDATH